MQHHLSSCKWPTLKDCLTDEDFCEAKLNILLPSFHIIIMKIFVSSLLPTNLLKMLHSTGTCFKQKGNFRPSTSISANCSMSISVYAGVLLGVAVSPYLKLFLLCLQSCRHRCSSSLFLASMTCLYVRHIDLQYTVCHISALLICTLLCPGDLPACWLFYVTVET